MEENIQNEEITTIDIGQFCKLLKKNLKLIMLTSILCALIAFAITTFLLPKKYASTSSIYLVPKINEQTGTIDSNALAANAKQVNNYMVMIKGENILSKVAKELNIDTGEISSSLSVSNMTNTEIIQVTATTREPKKSQQIVKTTITTFFNEVKEKLEIKNMTILNDAKENKSPVSPNIKLNSILGILLGMLASCGYVLAKFLFDKCLRTKNDVENYLGIPVLAEIPYYED